VGTREIQRNFNARDIVSDREKRAAYDLGGMEAVEGGGGTGGGVEDIFSPMFG